MGFERDWAELQNASNVGKKAHWGLVVMSETFCSRSNQHHLSSGKNKTSCFDEKQMPVLLKSLLLMNGPKCCICKMQPEMTSELDSSLEDTTAPSMYRKWWRHSIRKKIKIQARREPCIAKIYFQCQDLHMKQNQEDSVFGYVPSA